MITENQTNILQALADGEELKASAYRTGRSYATLMATLKLIRHKLGAKNSLHAVVIALRRGIIR